MDSTPHQDLTYYLFIILYTIFSRNFFYCDAQ